MKKANVSYRIHCQCWLDEKCFDQLLMMIRDIRPAGEYALLSDDNHTPRPVAEMLHRFDIMAERIARLRELDVSVGINILNTLGHCQEYNDCIVPMKRHFTGSDGYVFSGVACPGDPDWYENYLKPVYQKAASLHPDFIWIDDDFRLWRTGTRWCGGCFCPDCRQELHKTIGLPLDFAEIKSFFDCPDAETARFRRQSMLNWNQNVLISGAAKIEKYIHDIDAGIIIGQMDGLSDWHGLDHQKYFQTLSGAAYTPVWWRPGGGNYRDTQPETLIDKAVCLGRECAMIPPQVEVLEGEMENFNYQALHKSVRFAVAEPQLFCAAGLTGVTYNIFGDPAAERFSTYLPLVKALKKINPFLDQLVADNGRKIPAGIHDCITGQAMIADRDDGERSWLERDDISAEMFQTDLLKIGLPQGFDFDSSQVYMMRGKIAQSLERDQIMQILSKGVYLDALALDTLNKLGYGEFTGFELDNVFTNDTVERYTEHPLNNGFDGMLRNIRQKFFRDTSWSLRPAVDAEIVSVMENFCGRQISPCASGCFTNSLGGRIFVAGYGSWKNIYNTSKIYQLRRVFNYLSKDTLPGWINSCCRMAVWIRQLPDGGSCEIFNASMDAAERTEVILRTSAEFFTLYTADGKKRELTAVVKSGTATLVLPELAPWEVVHLVWHDR